MDIIKLAKDAGLEVLLQGRIGTQEYHSVSGTVQSLERFAEAFAATKTNINSGRIADAMLKRAADVLKPVYVLHPGFIKTSGGTFYVEAMRLARLYGVSMTQCELYREPVLNPRTRYTEQRVTRREVHLYPRDDGNYSLPKPVGAVDAA